MAISDLIAASGTSAGAIYHHFGNKQGVVLEVARTIIARPLGMVLATPEQANLGPADLLAAALGQVVADEDTPELLMQIWAGAKSDPELSRLLVAEGGRVRRAVRQVVQHWCDRHAPETDVDGLTAVLAGLVMGYAVQRAVFPIAELGSYSELSQQLVARFADS